MFKKFAKRNDEGLTLIEILITVVILGIISTITVLAVGGSLRAAQIKSCVADWNSVYVAAQAWQSDQTIGNLTPTSYPDITALASQGYMAKLDTSDRKYSLALTWPAPADPTQLPAPVITVSQNGATVTNSTGDTSRGADCKAVTN
jgi:prepilin-type N-terminal cleavage/methylation domain-containing protein